MALLGKKKSGEAAPPPAVAQVPSNTRAKNKKTRTGAVVGVNIGNYSVKAVEVTAKNGDLSITGMATLPTPPDAYQNGAILSNTALVNTLRDLWKAGGFKSKMAIISVAGTTSLIVRVIEVPKMTDGQLSDNMRVDADRYIPFPPSEVIMDFKALRELPSDPDAANMQVLLAAAQREVIDAHVSVIQKAKIDPRAIDVEPLAAVRALQVEKAAQGLVNYDEVNALLNIGASGTEITIVRGDVVVFTRTVPNGGANLTNSIAETLGVGYAEAEYLKTERGDALPPAGYSPGQNASNDFDIFGAPSATADFDNDFSQAAAPTAAPASDDPFDLDFFNQGPQNDEPSAGHGQKEGDTPKDEAFNFSFSDDDLPQSTAGQTPQPQPEPEDLNFAVEDETSLPAQTPAASPAPTAANPEPAPAPVADDLDPFNSPFSEELLPTAGISEPSVPIPSAFDFSDFDLPTVTTPPPGTEDPNLTSFAFTGEEILPSTSGPETSSAPSTPEPAPSFGGFSFDDDSSNVFIPEASTSSTQAVPVNEPLGVGAPLNASNDPAADDQGFDLDALFGKESDSFGAPDEATVGENLDLASAVSADDILPPLQDETDDFSSFGAGLVGGTGADTDEVALYEALRGPLEELVNEVRRSLEFHLDRQPDAPLSHIYLTGGGAKVKNFDIYLTQTIGVPTTILNPFAHMAVQASKPGSDFANAHAAECGVALGLALRDFVA